MKRHYTDYLKDLLRDSGLTLRELEKQTNIPEPTLSRYINGKNPAPMDRLTVIVEALGGNPDAMFAVIGKAEMEAAESVGYKGTEALIADYESRELRIRDEHAAQAKLQQQQTEMMVTFYERMLTHLKGRVDALEQKAIEYASEAKTYEERLADARERIKRIDERHHQVLVLMLVLCALCLTLGWFIDPPWRLM